MCIEYNECHYSGMYNIYVKRIFFVIAEIVHMNEKTGTSVSTEKEKVKESQSRSVTLSLNTPSSAGLGASHRSREVHEGKEVLISKKRSSSTHKEKSRTDKQRE